MTYILGVIFLFSDIGLPVTVTMTYEDYETCVSGMEHMKKQDEEDDTVSIEIIQECTETSE